MNFRLLPMSMILRYSPAQMVRSPSFERTLIRKPHPVQTLFPWYLLPGFFLFTIYTQLARRNQATRGILSEVDPAPDD